jgi:hypothetical protein
LQIECGNTSAFLLNYPDYPVGTYVLTFVLSAGTAAPSSTTATTSGTNFLVTLSAAATTALTPGVYQWAAYATSGSTRYTAATGKITLMPNLAATQTASFAQSMVTLLQTVLAAFAATDKRIVDFNGQRFERYAIKDYQTQYTYWKAALISEQAALAAQRGEGTGGRIVAQFLPSSDVTPIYNPTA